VDSGDDETNHTLANENIWTPHFYPYNYKNNTTNTMGGIKYHEHGDARMIFINGEAMLTSFELSFFIVFRFGLT
jgi:hypothetical protein